MAIVVTAQDGTTQTYTLNVTRVAAEPTSQNHSQPGFRN
ncbi:hypothetical protein [Alicyclobacillus fastidiosus]